MLLALLKLQFEGKRMHKTVVFEQFSEIS